MAYTEELVRLLRGDMTRPSRCLLCARPVKVGLLLAIILVAFLHLVPGPYSPHDLPAHRDVRARTNRKQTSGSRRHGSDRRTGQHQRPEAPMRQLHAEPPAPPGVADLKKADDRLQLRPPLLPVPPDISPKHSEHPLKIIAEEKKAYFPCAWVDYKANDDLTHHVIVTFRKLGYKIHHRNETFVDCDVIWTFDYPFWSKCWNKDLVRHITRRLGRYQKVNHFPGIGYVADKVNLARSSFPFTPPAFILPGEAEDFLKATRHHPTWMWVQKNRGHRGVKITKPQEVDLRGNGTFVQYYVDSPLLIDGRKFDFSVYVALTSVNPLRLYIYGGDWAVRFCRRPYEPFDASDTNRYVLYGADHVPIWEMPSLTYYWKSGYGFKKSLFIYLKQKGHDIDKLESSIYDIVRSVFQAKEKDFVRAVKLDFFAYNDTRNLFELVRFDFILDKTMRVYLMEINMSPDLSTVHGGPRGELYQNIIYGFLSMASISTVLKDKTGKRVLGDTGLMVSTRDLRVFEDECESNRCQDSCEIDVCQLCPGCLKSDIEEQLRTAHIEHNHKQGFRRLVPKPFANQQHARLWTLEDDPAVKSMTQVNRLLYIWFRGKCLQDANWCS